MKRTEKIKILILTHCFPADRNDIPGNFLADLTFFLSEQNAEVTVLTQKMNVEPDPEFIRSTRAEIKYFDWKGGDKRFSEMKMSSIKNSASVLSLILSGRKSYRKLLGSRKFDLVISAWAVPAGLWSHKIKKPGNIPEFIWALGSDISVYSEKFFFKNLIENILRKKDRVFSNSLHLKKIILDKFDLPAELLYTNRILPDPDSEYKESDILKLVFIGRLEKIKGPDILIDTFIEHSMENIHLTVIGEGSMRKELEKTVDSNNLNSKIAFTGNKGAEFIAETLKKSDYLVISSRKESMPVVFWEAMQTGTPVLSTDTGDIKYYCYKYNVGRTCPMGVRELADLIKFVRDLRPLRSELAANTGKLNEISSIKSSASKILGYIKKID